MLMYSSEIEIEPKFQSVEETHFTIPSIQVLTFHASNPKIY